MHTKTTAEFIEEIRAHIAKEVGKPVVQVTNYAIARYLDQTDTDVARWAKKKSTFSDAMCIRVADLLGYEEGYVAACVHAERAKHEKERAMWERMANLSMGIAAALLLAVALPFVGVPIGDVIVSTASAEESSSVYYVKLLVVHYWPLAALAIAFWLALPYHPAPQKEPADKLAK